MPTQYRFDEQKATEAASTLLNLKNGRVEYLWLVKMLYFIDREAFARWERPVTYDHYVSMPHGPVVSNIYDLIMGKSSSVLWKKIILTLGKRYEVMLNGSMPKIKKLSRAEIELIQELYKEYGHLTGFQLVDLSHKLPEWQDPKGSSIPIELPNLLKELNYTPEDIERINSELQEELALDSLLGA